MLGAVTNDGAGVRVGKLNETGVLDLVQTEVNNLSI